MPDARTVLAAPDKFRGTATAAEVADAVAAAAAAAGWGCDAAPMADGGEGILEVLGGQPRHRAVRGPLGQPVDAEWRQAGDRAVIETARACGLALAGGPEGNDPMQASTYGAGQLIDAAIELGARELIIGVGGSATTDGGLGAVTALGRHRLAGVNAVVACDVETTFVDAAEVFAPQKGATAAQVALLHRRLERLAEVYERDYGVDVRSLYGSGAAGGLAGGLAALGARLVPGFDVVAEAVDLGERMERVAAVVTGEGLLDEESFHGKVVGGVVELAAELGLPVLVVVGDIDPDAASPVEAVSLVERFGEERAYADVVGCVQEVVTQWLTTR